MGLEVERHDFWPLLSQPVSASLRITSPTPLALDLAERPISPDDNIIFAWNAYAASADVQAPVVYVNYRTKQNFQQLAALGVETKGTIALAWSGESLRAYRIPPEAPC